VLLDGSLEIVRVVKSGHEVDRGRKHEPSG
jgi:hypothetical protein